MNSCPELKAIADELSILNIQVIAVVLCKLLWWMVQPWGGSSTSHTRTSSDSSEDGWKREYVSLGGSVSEAEQAYREKHWGSYMALRKTEQRIREDEIRRDERRKCSR